jgi:mRNA interferase HicA
MFTRLTGIYVHGCILKRKGSRHSLCQNPTNGVVEAVSRHVEIDSRLLEKICKHRGIPQPGEASAN